MMLLYDKDLRFLGPVDFALKEGFEQKLNELSVASLELAAKDPANEKILVPASFARIYDGKKDLGFYRFAQLPRGEHTPLGRAAYSLQSAQCTLLDDLLDGWHEIGGTEFSTRMVLEYILSRQSAEGTRRWVLGDCEFEDYYQYNFQDVTLLEAIMSLGEVLLDPYEFVFDTTASPWTMHLRRAEEAAYCSLTYGRNATAIRRSITGGVVTRLYGRGYGEGDNQLTIASVNGGVDYLDADPETMAKWGVRCGVHVDTRQTDPATLKARMQAILEAGKQPRVSYEASAIDLARLTGESWDDVAAGKKVMILDEMLGMPVTVRVKSRKKDDAAGRPGDVAYVLDNAAADTAEELNEILEKIGVHELYSQGATNMYSMQVSDNADADHPLAMRFYVPGNVLRINSCLLTWNVERFRTYVTMTESGGGSSQTSQSGGGVTVTVPTFAQSFAAATSNPIGPGDDTMNETDGAGDHDHKTNEHDHSFSDSAELSWNHVHMTGDTYTSGVYNYGAKTITVSGRTGKASPRTGTAGRHVHGMKHVHSVEVSVKIPAQEIKIEGHRHIVEIPAHTHELQYGVYEGARAGGVTVRVDGEAIPGDVNLSDREFDVAPYLKKNDDGRVTRGAWHEVEFVPDGLTRLTANLFFQVFIQSRGAGDY